MSAEVKPGDTLYVPARWSDRIDEMTVEKVMPKTIKVVGSRDRWERVEGAHDDAVAKRWSGRAYPSRNEAINAVVFAALRDVKHAEAAVDAAKARLAKAKERAARLRAEVTS